MAILGPYYINPVNNKIIFISKQININTIKFSVKASHLQRFSPLQNSNIFHLLSPVTLIPKTQQNYLPILFKNYSTMSEALHPAWVTGFVDAEGCFHISITKKKELNVEWQVRLYFEIGLSNIDKALIEKIKKFFGVGLINKDRSKWIKFSVKSLKDLLIIINHFDKYPLITRKYADFLIFKKVFQLIKNKEHLTKEGIEKVVALKASHNLGLSDKLKQAFHDVHPVARPIVIDQKIKNPHWLSGFTSGEGCFLVVVKKSPTNSIGFQVLLVFQLTQHSRDELLMKSLIEYLQCGYITKNRETFDLKVTKFDDIVNKIIPLFQKYRIEGVKAKDFEDFCQIADMMKEKKHLTLEGLEKIHKIKAGMNRGRKWD